MSCVRRASQSVSFVAAPRAHYTTFSTDGSAPVARARPLPDCVDSGQVFRGQGLPGLAMLAPLALIYQSVTQSVISRSRPARARSPLRPRLSVRLRRSRSNISTEYIVLAPGGYSIIASEVILSQRAGWSLRAFCTLLLGLYTGTHESVSLISRSSPCSRPSPVRCRTSVRRAFALHRTVASRNWIYSCTSPDQQRQILHTNRALTPITVGVRRDTIAELKHFKHAQRVRAPI